MNEDNYGVFWAMEDWWMSHDYDEYMELSDQATEMFGEKTPPQFLRWYIQFTKREQCRSA